ncbi:competence protein ComEA [Kushneria avicenniae]|uniref:Competence protein ComEA n=1 Tax=Kushneria avicenniae TaxID=402385 RepID=A0A1I1KXA8_9GAMM|nr:helix-hairpin-helix domain-containing protein [Kushneria avicenniae]SFC65439.1 competence protein ComEA [Kushneria avicenniae]
MSRKLLAMILTTAALSLSAPLMADELAVNINTATAAELTALPGIGEKKADAIVADREENGAYESADDLSRVSGIGSATVDQLRDGVEL